MSDTKNRLIIFNATPENLYLYPEVKLHLRQKLSTCASQKDM